jgi:hypothetical protein
MGDLTAPDSTQDPLPTSRHVASKVTTSAEAHSASAAKNTVTQTESGVKPMDVMAEAAACSPTLQASAVIELTGQSLPYTLGKKNNNRCYSERLFSCPVSRKFFPVALRTGDLVLD